MDRIFLMVMIGFLFATTLYQAREIGEQGVMLAVQKAAMEHRDETNKIKVAHQMQRDKDKIDNDELVQGLKNELTEMASTFEDMGLSDASALGERESVWLNDFMRRNSRQARSDDTNDKNIPPTDSNKADKAKD